ncbi:MAG: TonB-dependent receptor, partial [Bacteroidales bacterium]|nr:TonB-dependent receptor [Bacteroidales bacterium]
ITEENIKKNAGNGSISNLFEIVPSMTTTSDAGTGIGYTYMRIRGIDQTRINVTLNGIPINDAESQGAWLVNLPDLSGKTQNLEIQRGAGTSNNGAAAFGATMNFITLEPAEKSFFEFNSAAGSFYTFKNSISASTGRIHDRFSAAIAYSNILSRGYIEHASANLNSLYFTADYKFLSKDKTKSYGNLRFNYLFGKEKTGLAWNGVPKDSLTTHRRYNSCGEYFDNQGVKHYYKNETDNYQQHHFQLFYTGYNKSTAKNRLRYDLKLHLTRGIGYYEEYQDDALFETYGFNDVVLGTDTCKFSEMITRKYLDNYFYGFNFNIQQNINKNKTENGITQIHQWNWNIGGDIKRFQGAGYGSVIWAEYAENLPINTHWYDETGDKTQANLFGTLSYSNEHLFTYIDLQYRVIYYKIDGMNEHLHLLDQNYLWNFFNPKTGINYSWNTHKKQTLTHSLYFSFAIAHREPTRSDLTESELERRPVPERLYDFECGYRVNASHLFSFNANGYFMYYQNQLILTGEINSIGAAIMTNAPKSFRAGIELVATYAPLIWFRWNGNVTFSTNKIINYTEYVDNWDNGGQIRNPLGTTTISFSPSIVASNRFTFTPVKNFDISLFTKFVSRQYLDNGENKDHSLKPYCTNDLQFDYALYPKHLSEIGFFFHLNNIFNVKYANNGWLYKYQTNNTINYTSGYYVQAGFNFIGGIRLRF